jgi:hypothetical protein
LAQKVNITILPGFPNKPADTLEGPWNLGCEGVAGSA